MNRSSVFQDFLARYRIAIGPNIYIASPFSKGDTYLLASVAQEALEKYAKAGFGVVMFVKHSHVDIVEMFADRGVRFITVPDQELERVRDIAAESGYCPSFEPETLLLVHPSSMGARELDQLTFSGTLTQLDMYRHLMKLPLGGDFDRGTVPDEWRIRAREYALELGIPRGEGVLFLPSSNSWPELDVGFWHELTNRFAHAGVQVYTNVVRNQVDEVREDLGGGVPVVCDLPVLFGLAEHIGWVVGTLTGLLNIMISSQVKAAKTMLACGPARGESLAFGPTANFASAYPYAFQRTYDGCDYDVEEFEVTPENREMVLANIVGSWNRQRSNPSGEVRQTVYAPTGFGDVLDRISILEVKRKKLSDPRVRYDCNRELVRLWAALSRQHISKDDVQDEFAKLLQVNEEGFDVNEVLYSTFDNSLVGRPDWTISAERGDELADIEVAIKAFRLSQALNRRRVALKRQVDERFGSVVTESKSFPIAHNSV